MTDIKLQWIDAAADTAIGVDDLLAEEGLETAVILSLFTDARVEATELPDGVAHRRGWWADSFSNDQNDASGSKLWTLWRAKRTNETLAIAKQYCEQALQWMVDDGVAASVTVSCEFGSLADLTSSGARPDEFALVILPQIVRPDGTREAFRFAYAWQQQAEVI